MLNELLEQTPIAVYAVIAIVSYFIGSIPTAYLACKAKGVDIRTVGSGNVGATNAARVLGKSWGVVILLIDALKGLIPTMAVWLLFLPKENAMPLMMTAALSAIIGHVFPIWLKFKGGKGVATSLGVMIALVPDLILYAGSIFLITVIITRYVSLGSILGALSLVVLFLILDSPSQNTALFLFLICIAVFVVYKHRTNIHRLIKGTESKFGTKLEVKK